MGLKRAEMLGLTLTGVLKRSEGVHPIDRARKFVQPKQPFRLNKGKPMTGNRPFDPNHFIAKIPTEPSGTEANWYVWATVKGLASQDSSLQDRLRNAAHELKTALKFELPQDERSEIERIITEIDDGAYGDARLMALRICSLHERLENG